MRGWGGDYCILEIVTTGPDPETAMPVEAAAIRVKEGAEADSICLLIDPGVPVPACLRERSGREEGEYLAGMEPRAALARVRAFLAHRHVLAHEGTGMEAALLERFGALPAGAVLDTQELAWLVSPYLRDHSLAALASSLLGEAPSWKALEDARLLLRILARLREAWGEAPRRVREAVAAALEEADSPWREFLLSRRGRRYPDLTEDIAGAGEAPWPRGRRGVREGRAGGGGGRHPPGPGLRPHPGRRALLAAA